MWPFSGGSKDTSKVVEELPDHLKEFFKENNPDLGTQLDETARRHRRVNDVLVRDEKKTKSKFNPELEKYKSVEDRRTAVAVNCAEIQQQVLDCLKDWSVISGSSCTERMKTNTSCVQLQNEALKKLFYDDCYNVEQCKYIRYVVDQFFTKNFGQYGETINEETKETFNKDIDGVFNKVWK